MKEESNADTNFYLTFLKNNPIMSLAAVLDGKPIASIVLFCIHDNFDIDFVTGQSTFKSKALIQNPFVSFNVFKQQQLLIQGSGNVTKLENTTETDKILEKIIDTSQNMIDMWPPLLQFSSNEFVYFRITPTWMRALDISKNANAGEVPYTDITLPTAQ